MTVGERIKEARIQLGLSQVEFADKINVSKQTLYKYENNIITNIPSDKIEAAATLSGVSPAYLMGWEPPVKLISNEMKRVSGQTNLYIQLFESYGYEINLNSETVEIKTKSKQKYVFNRKDFMSMINRCYKDMNYNIERLIDEHITKKSELLAAHQRTDIEVTPEGTQNDLNIMNDDSLWK